MPWRAASDPDGVLVIAKAATISRNAATMLRIVITPRTDC
jgi:hypothetical protein